MINFLFGLVIGILLAYHQPEMVAAFGQWFISIIPK